MSFSQAERQRLANTFLGVGPDAPTLCAPWSTRDLLVHLIIREGSFLAAGGIVVPLLARFTRRREQQLATFSFQDLVDRFRSGGPRFHPLMLGDRFANVAEFFVHHEDIRRAQGDYQPRCFHREEEKELVRAATRVGKILVGSGGIPVVLEPSGWPRTQVGGRLGVAKQGDRVVRVSGAPGEVLLWLYGRPAQVELSGPVGEISLRHL